MAEERLPNRWMFAIAAIVMQLCLGNLYSWSIFRSPLMKLNNWTISQATWPFNLSIFFFALAMVGAGRWQDKVGPRIVAMTGGVILAVGFLLASVAGNTLPGIYFAYGVLGGAGVGFAYVTPIACLIKWFPDMRGLMTGVAVLGFGAGSMIGAPVGTALIARVGVYSTFAIFGIAFGVLVVLSGAMLKNPPAGYRPAGWTPPAPAAGKPAVAKYDYTPSEILAVPQTYLLWFTFLMWASIGLMAISQAVPLAQELAGATPAVAAGALGTMAIFNGLGRPAAGWLSDKIGRNWAAVVAFAIYIVGMLAVIRGATTIGMFTVGLSMVGFAYGAEFAVMPAFTADYFGTKNVGINYGIVFTAWGVAGIVGPVIGAQVRTAFGSFLPAFWILSGMGVLGIIAVLITRHPAPREVEAKA